MKGRLILAVVVALGGFAVTAGVVLATPQTGFTPEQQWKGVFGEIDVKTNGFLPHQVKLKTKEASDVYVTRNSIAVGGQSGWHTHPGPSLIIVTVGEIMAYDGDDPTCTPTRYRAGEGFVDPGDGHVHLLRNESSAPAETVAVQFLPKDARRRIDTPAPPSCPF
jgi:quercetin dioxygenase-like cupin family protein